MLANGSTNKQDLVRSHLRADLSASNLVFNEKIKAMMRAGQLVYHFGFGQSPFPVPDCMVKALQENAFQNEYLSIQGLPSLRQGIASFHQRLEGLSLDPERIIVAPGSKQLIYLVMAVFDGVVILPTPAWPTYAPQVQLAGLPIVEVKTAPGLQGGFKLTPEGLREALRGQEGKNSLLILTNPGNPTGTCYSAQELKNIGSVCREKGVIVIADEIYSGLKFEGRHESILTSYPEGTILTSGFSKWASAGGWRLGYAHFPPQLSDLQDAVAAGVSQTFSCPSAPIQFAIAQVLKENQDEILFYMKDCRKILKAVGDYCYKELNEVGVTGTKGEAGYYFMPDFGPLRTKLNARGIFTGRQMIAAMLAEPKVALMPAINFHMPDEDLSTRFCFVCFDGQKTLDAIKSLREATGGSAGGYRDVALTEDFVKEHCGHLVEGVQALKKWCLQ